VGSVHADDEEDPTPVDGEGTPISSGFLHEVARAPAVAPGDLASLTGATIGRYHVLEELGRGGMGVVYAAEDVVLQRPVALKVLPPHLVRDAERRRRFLREARLCAAAAHPNIAAIYGVEEEGREGEEQILIAMERIDGSTLREALAAAPGGLPAREVARVGHQIALGLQRAHEAGVIHRDLKPDNVMIGIGGQVKILDFGVAKLRQGDEGAGSVAGASTLTGEGQLIGTPSYMAPEQAKGLSIDVRADIFSVGVILYEAATGARPFSGATAAEVLIAVDRDEPPLPSQRNPTVPPPLERIIARCLQKRADDRYASCRELAEELAEVAASDHREPDVASPRSLQDPLGSAPPRRRWAWAASIASVAALAGAAALAASLSRGGDAREASPVAAAPTASPLSPPDAALACPILETTTSEPRSGWLGAAAASIACRRARAILGGSAARVIVPAKLLDLPPRPVDDFPRDPYAAVDARPRALAAARARGAAYLDGSVALDREGFRVRLVLEDPQGRALAGGDGQSTMLPRAIREAMDTIERAGALPRAAAVDPEIAVWSGLRDVSLLLAVQDWDLVMDAAGDPGAEQAALAPRRADLGPRWERMRAASASILGEGWDDLPAPPLDRSSPAAFARSAPVHATLDLGANAAALADEARGLAAAEPSAEGRAALAMAEAELRNRAGDSARAAALLVAVVEHDPTPAAWDALMSTSSMHQSQTSSARTYAAWVPEAANAWNLEGIIDMPLEEEPSGMMAQRARALSAGAPLLAVHHGMTLLSKNKRDEARAVAAELLSSAAAPTPGTAADPRLVAGEYLLARLEASEARFGAALARGRRVLFAQPRFGRIAASDMYLLTLLLNVAEVVGRSSEVAEEVVRVFLDPEPPRLYPGRHVPGRVASACAFAPPAVARRCFTRLRALGAAGFFREPMPPDNAAFMDGAEAYARADYAAAVTAWRPMTDSAGTQGTNLLADAFYRAGEVDLAQRIDGDVVDQPGAFNGAGLPHLRAARRAIEVGDRERAEQLVRRMVEAWSVADVPVPALAELRARLARLPPGFARPDRKSR
jgi:predicted Ser/Thr protein kinase